MSRYVLLVCPLLFAAASAGCSSRMREADSGPGHAFGNGGLLTHRYDAPAPWGAYDSCANCARKSAASEGCAACAKKQMPAALVMEKKSDPESLAQSKKAIEESNEGALVSPYAAFSKNNPNTLTTDYHDDSKYFPSAPKSDKKR